MKNKYLQPNLWINYIYKIKNNLLTNDLIINKVNNFWNTIMVELEPTQYVLFLFKIKFSGGTYATLTKLQKFCNSDTDLKTLIDVLCGTLDHKSEEYHTEHIVEIIFHYYIIPKNKTKKGSKFTPTVDKKSTKVPFIKLKGFNLPSTLDLNKWGTHLLSELNSKGDKIDTLKVFKQYNYVYIIHHQEKKRLVTIVNSSNKNILSFTDYIIDQSLDKFKRIITNQEYYFSGGKLIVKTFIRKTNYLLPIKKQKKLTNKFITLDIETRNIDNVLTPFCISFYDGTKYYSYYLSDFSSSDNMIMRCISDLMKAKYDKYIIYCHNLSGFDGIYLLRILASFKNAKLYPILRDDKMINLHFEFKSNSTTNYRINFRDSLLMLPYSLEKLTKTFDVDRKLFFPHDLIEEFKLPLDFKCIIDSKYEIEHILESTQDNNTTIKIKIEYITLFLR